MTVAGMLEFLDRLQIDIPKQRFDGFAVKLVAQMSPLGKKAKARVLAQAFELYAREGFRVAKASMEDACHHGQAVVNRRDA